VYGSSEIRNPLGRLRSYKRSEISMICIPCIPVGSAIPVVSNMALCPGRSARLSGPYGPKS